MAKQKDRYYVLVITEDGPVFVTKVNYSNKTAFWNKNEKPLEMSMSSADDLVFGLACNFNVAYTVKVPYELESQPYRYDAYDFTMIKKEDGKADEV